ncbi:Fc.00g081860.m01.CDS01 [Cosmosporella sp. VM-42]
MSTLLPHNGSRPKSTTAAFPLDIGQMAESLASPSAIEAFSENIERIYIFWVQLRVGSSFKHGADSDDSIVRALQFIDEMIANKENPRQLSRLSHIALINLIEEINKQSFQRRQGLIQSKSGHRKATLAIDLYLTAQGPVHNKAHAKKQLNRRLQISRRWMEMPAGCPLLLVTLGDAAEKIV